MWKWTLVFRGKILLGHSHLLCLYSVYSYSFTRVATPSPNRDNMACKAENISYLPFTEKFIDPWSSLLFFQTVGHNSKSWINLVEHDKHLKKEKEKNEQKIPKPFICCQAVFLLKPFSPSTSYFS
jgi:hypothetical protein